MLTNRMEGFVAYRGAKFRIVYAVRSNGSCPAREFYDSLPESDRAKIMALFVRMGDHGQIRNEEKFKHVEGPYYAFKSFQIRILCRFQPGGRLLLLHGLHKKKDRYNPMDIETAERIFAEHSRGKLP